MKHSRIHFMIKKCSIYLLSTSLLLLSACDNTSSLENTAVDISLTMPNDQSLDLELASDIDLIDLMISDQFIQDQNFFENFSQVEGGNPLNPAHPLYPYPSSFFLQADTTTATGWRVEIASHLPVPGVSSEYLAQHDGFSRMPMILSQWPNGIDPQSLGDAENPAHSLLDTSISLLIEVETLTRIPHLTEVDLSTTDRVNAPLIIRPLNVLKANHSYVVVIKRGLQDIDQNEHQAPLAFQALRDQIPSAVAEIEKLRIPFESIRQVVTQSDIEMDQVLLAWSFHTRSEQNSVVDLLNIQQQAKTWPLGEWSITEDRQEDNNRQLEGTFEVPLFVGEEGLVYDEDGVAIPVGTAFYPFVFTIPNTIEGEARPSIVFGHGFLGDRFQATRSSFNDLCRQGRYSSLAVNFGLHEETLPLATQGLIGNEAALPVLLAEVMQTMVNTSMLVRLIQEKLSVEFPELDAQQVNYMGISNGGTFGFLFAATTDLIKKAILVVGGGGLSHFLQRATQWNELGILATNQYEDPADLQLFLSILQSILDPIDSINYADRLVEPRFENLNPIQIQAHMAIHDSQVDNLVTEWVARSAHLSLMVPSPKEIWGLDQFDASSNESLETQPLGTLYVYDEYVEAPPAGNVAPLEDNRTHQTVRGYQAYKDHIINFINTGVFTFVCEGPCDPE